ncbi:MAG: MSMEG_0567/Sll0786 family nitrogen starvation N-acetyltransferase [Acidimicrobiales bacterium]
MAPADDLAPTDARPLSCRIAADPLEVELHHRIRREIFVAEQAIFAGDDRDARDDDPEVLKVLGLCGPTAAGAVRLYRIDAAADTWMGDRLAVLRRFRRHGLGAPLVRFAVRTAGQRGGRVMLAHIQPANVRWFERLGWERSGDPEIYVGLPHQPMQIALDAAAPSGVTSRSSERASADR